MNRRILTIAGRLSMFSAFASLPAAFLSWKLEGRVDGTATLIQTAMQSAGTALFVIITLLLKKLLNEHFRFHETDSSLDWMIRANVVAGLLAMIALWSHELKDTLGLAILVMVLVQGVVQVRFGYRLLRLPDNLGGLLRPFGYCNMLTGILLASVVLLVVGVVVSAIADLMLATIFFHAAGRLHSPET